MHPTIWVKRSTRLLVTAVVAVAAALAMLMSTTAPASAATAPPASSQVAPQPAAPITAIPSAAVHCGIITCTAYLNRTETRGVALGGAATAIVGNLNLPGWVKAAIVGAIGWFIWTAANADAQGKCLKIKFGIRLGSPVSPGIYGPGDTHGGDCH